MKEIPHVPSGIPSACSLHLDNPERLPSNLGIADILTLIFPPGYQPQYFKISHTLLTLLLEEQTLETNDLKEFMEKNNYSRSTLYGEVIPKLVYFGLVKKEVIKGKGKPIRLTPSPKFSEILHRIASSWEMIVALSRAR